MKISELVEKLNSVKEEVGDIEVVTYDKYGTFLPVQGIRLDVDTFDNKEVVEILLDGLDNSFF